MAVHLPASDITSSSQLTKSYQSSVDLGSLTAQSITTEHSYGNRSSPLSPWGTKMLTQPA